MNIEKLMPAQFAIWDGYVMNNPAGTIFHTSKWLLSFDCMCTITVVRNKKEEIIGGCALVKTKKFGITGYHTPPFTPYFGPIYGNIDPKKDNTTEENEVVTLLLESLPKSNQYSFILTPGHHSPLPYKWKGFTDEINITHIVENQARANYLDSITADKRRQIRKIQNENSDSGTIKIVENIDINDIWDLWSKTAERAKFNPRKELFFKLFDNPQIPIITQGVSVKNKGLIAAVILVYDNNSIYNLINGSERIDIKELRTVNLYLLFHTINNTLINQKKFDFEGSSLKGVEMFYREMGGISKPIYRFQKFTGFMYGGLRTLQFLKQNISKLK